MGISTGHKVCWGICGILGGIFWSVGAQADTWQVMLSEPGRKIEINASTIVRQGNKATVSSKVTLETPLDDLRSNTKYQIIETTTRYDCDTKTGVLVKRTLRKGNDELVREEDGKGKQDVPVRSGTVDERLMQEVCKMPEGKVEPVAPEKSTEKPKAVGGLRRQNLHWLAEMAKG